MDVNGFVMVKPGAPERLSIGYFGAQGTHATKLMPYLDGATQFVDLTAGGMGIPYRICLKKKLPVVVNDISFYSHVCGCAVFLPQDLHAEAFWREMLVAAKAKATEGLLVEMLTWDWLPSDAYPKMLPTETLAYLDGLLQLANTCDAPDLLYAAIGKMLLTDLAFRGLGFTAVTTDDVHMLEITPDAMIERILKHLGYFVWKNTLLPDALKAENVVSWDDAGHFGATFNRGFQDAVVYVDPAWPWNKPNQPNPYFLSSVVLPCILKQTASKPELVAMQPWLYGEEDRILEDVIQWTTHVLQRGARKVIVNTRGTNYPDPKVIEPKLQAALECTGTIECRASTSQGENKVHEFAWIFEGVK